MHSLLVGRSLDLSRAQSDEDPAAFPKSLEAGTAGVSAVLVALGDAAVDVHHVELDEPSLDDVFADATGRRLEGGETDS